MPPLHRLILLAFALSSAPALAASTAAEAERTRLADEMKRLSSRNAWKGVDDAYRRLETLAAEEGVALTYRDHFLGASAARELGDTNAVYVRLQRALALEKTEEVTSWLADLNQNFGQIVLRIDSKYPGDRSLTISEMPFDPAQRRVIEAAQLALQESRTYTGILPVGSYTFGDKKFDIAAGGAAAQEVVLEAKSMRDDAGEGGLSYAGPRLDLGVSFTVAGEPTEANSPSSFSGVGARLGVGFEFGFSTKVGLLTEVGYHGLLWGSDPASSPTQGDWEVDQVSARMNLGYGWLAGALRLGDLRLALGPTFSLGRASAMGTGTVPDGSGVSGGTVWEAKDATVYGPGAELGVFYGFLNSDKTQSGLGLHGGAFSDGDRLYPWAQLAFTLAPAAYRRDG